MRYWSERAEILEFSIEPEVFGTLVQDCEVCCNPLQVTITLDRYGDPEERVERVQ